MAMLMTDSTATSTTPTPAAAPTPAPTPIQAQPQPGNALTISPDAGIYGQESAAALQAYQSAQAQLLAQRNGLYNQYGFTQQGLVDPNNPYGQYQMLLGSEGAQLTADQNNAESRNLGTGGLANQQISADRFQQNAQNNQFQQQVGNVATNYNLGLQSAQSTYDQAQAQAYSDAMNAALQQALINAMNGSGGSGGSGGGTITPPPGGNRKTGTPAWIPFSKLRSTPLPNTRVKGGKI